ncbi:MAG: NYN domain-containing protein [Nitrospinota bacterium]
MKETVAVYWDFENIHASLYDAEHGFGSYSKVSNRNRHQELLVDVNALYDFAATFGNVAINKAYCNWQWFSNYRQALLKCAIELIQIFPPGASAKNGADIKLSLDAVEDILRFPHISSLIVIGGDSDFIPLAQKIKASGKDLVGVGCRTSTNPHWANSCSDFKYYETFTMAPQTNDEDSEVVVTKDAVELITRAIRQISARNGDKWVVKAAIRPVIKRFDPTFDEASYNCKTFSDLLKKHADKFRVEQGEHDHIVCLIE